MSAHVEWMTTSWLSAAVVDKGAAFSGSDDVVDREAAIVINGDNTLVIEGSLASLLRFATYLLAEVELKINENGGGI